MVGANECLMHLCYRNIVYHELQKMVRFLLVNLVVDYCVLFQYVQIMPIC